MDPLRPVKHDCNGFSTVKSVPITCDYNVLTLFSVSDAIENTAQAKKRKIPLRPSSFTHEIFQEEISDECCDIVLKVYWGGSSK